LDDAKYGCHSGNCDTDIEDLLSIPRINKQVSKWHSQDVRAELKEYGAWDDYELSDVDPNLLRILWIACGDVVDNPHEY
jgi:hypothetical protein